MSQFCENCGAPLPDDAVFCEACGTKVTPFGPAEGTAVAAGSEQTAPASAPAQHKQRGPVLPEENRPSPLSESQKNRASAPAGPFGFGGFRKIALICVAVTLIAVVVMFALRAGKKENRGETESTRVSSETAMRSGGIGSGPSGTTGSPAGGSAGSGASASAGIQGGLPAAEQAAMLEQGMNTDNSAASGSTGSQEIPTVGGGEWIQIASIWFYQKDGELVKNSWVNDNGVYYYVDESGYMISNAYTPDGCYMGADGSYDPNAPQNQGGGASSASGTPAGEAMAAIAQKLSTDEIAGATEFDWFLDYVNKTGNGNAEVITDPARATRITDVQEALNGGWKAFICTEKGAYGSDVERYLNADIEASGGRFNITLNWKYLADPDSGTIEETGHTTYRGTYDDLKGTATAQTSDSMVEFEGFYLSSDGNTEYGVGTFRWIHIKML